MGELHHQSKVLFWKKFTKEERKAILSARAKKGWANKTPEEKKQRSLLMQKARLKNLTKS
jgi:hypothetical protein